MGAGSSRRASIAGRIASQRARSSARRASVSAASVALTSRASASLTGPTVASPAMANPLERRLRLAHLPTPLEPMERLGARLGMVTGALWVKRDDATGLAGGGNKARKLEYLCADAIERGCDTLVTGGGRQSNHVRMTAAAANRLGLACTIVLGAEEPSTPSGNLLLDELMGADIVWADDWEYYAVEAEITATCDRLRAAGQRPYAMPIGGAS